MQAQKNNQKGFTLLELALTCAIVVLLASIAIPLYTDYSDRARASEILLRYDAVRSGLQSTITNEIYSNCGDIAAQVPSGNLGDDYARLSLGFEAINGVNLNGYRPVLLVCAKNDAQGDRAVRIAQAAFEELSLNGKVEAGAIVSPILVSFGVSLTDDNRAVCGIPTGAPTAPCGDPIAVPSQMTIQAPQVAQRPPVAAPTPIAIRVPKIQAYVMKFSGSDTFIRPAGRRLDTGGDLTALTLDMSFIGDGSIPASSGGQGPVMFNYGDDSNNHNALSLWNPRSLTVALGGADHDTGINLADGLTHRVTVTWSSSTGELSVYDNGVLLHTFDNVAKGQTMAGNGNAVVAHKDNGGADGGYRAAEAFTGQVFHASFANVAIDAAQAATPLNRVLDPASGLLVDFRTVGSSIVDTTGRHTAETGGVTPVITGVEGNLVN